MLTRVEIENFKAIEKLAMDFASRLTVIVGPNGSGKTSILQAICSQSKATRESHWSMFRRLGSSKSPRVELKTSVGGVVFDPDVPGNPPELLGKMKMVDIPSPVFLHCDYDKMTRPSLEGSSLYSDGSNLSAVLAALKLNDPEKFDLIETSFRTIVPQIARIRFAQVPLRGMQLVSSDLQSTGLREMPTASMQANGFQLLFDTTNVVGVPADSASEGTLLSLAIVTAIVTNDGKSERIVLIDDLDASLHPAAQQFLIDAIRKLLELRPNLQIIATSHSPYLLHSLDFNEVRLTTLRDDGTVACGRLIDHPDFERWKEEMTPGEMWSMFGEKWLIDMPNVEPVA